MRIERLIEKTFISSADTVKSFKYGYPLFFGGLFLVAKYQTSEFLQQGNLEEALNMTNRMIELGMITGLSYPGLNFIEKQLRNFVQKKG